MKSIIALIMIAIINFSCSGDKKVVIGKWVDTSQYGMPTIVIYEKGNDTYLEYLSEGTVTGTHELAKEEVEGKLRYVQKDGGYVGKYYVIDSKNVLRIYTEHGLTAAVRSTE